MLVYFLEVNDVASALTATLSSAIAGPASDLANEVAVTEGDSLRFGVTNPGAIVGVRPNVVLEYHVP